MVLGAHAQPKAALPDRLAGQGWVSAVLEPGFSEGQIPVGHALQGISALKMASLDVAAKKLCGPFATCPILDLSAANEFVI